MWRRAALELDRPAAPRTEIVMARGVGRNLPTVADLAVALGAHVLGHWLWLREAAAPEEPADPVVTEVARR